MTQSRRNFLKASVASGMAAAVTATGSSLVHAADTARPNILWIVSEDNNPFIGAYGDKLAHTPVIDALAQQGLSLIHI